MERAPQSPFPFTGLTDTSLYTLGDKLWCPLMDFEWVGIFFCNNIWPDHAVHIFFLLLIFPFRLIFCLCHFWQHYQMLIQTSKFTDLLTYIECKKSDSNLLSWLTCASVSIKGITWNINPFKRLTVYKNSINVQSIG